MAAHATASSLRSSLLPKAPLATYARCSVSLEAEPSPEAARGLASSLLLAAARLEPDKLSLSAALTSTTPLDGGAADAIELPRFDHTSTLVLRLPIPFTTPTAGAFARLESLEVTTSHRIPADSWPRLRVLRINAVEPLEVVTVRSTTLEELAVTSDCECPVRRLHVDAPLLRAAKLDVSVGRRLRLSFSVPKVEQLQWRFDYEDRSIVGRRIMFLSDIEYSMSLGIRTLRIRIISFGYFGYARRSFAQEISRVQVADFSVLRLIIEPGGHALGPLLVHLLQIRPVIRRLELELPEPGECTQDCPCLQPAGWKNKNISLNELEEVIISYDFEIGDGELDFLKLLFRCAPNLKRMKVELTGEGSEKVSKIYEENPHVECDVRSF